MHETSEDLARVDRLLEASYQSAGAHLRSIVTPERRLGAAELAATLRGVCVLNLATVNRAGEPRVAPVDGLFYRGDLWFGSSHESVRFRHLRRRPQVSATHVRGERLGVIVHGRALTADLGDPAHAGFRGYLREVYGSGWDDWGAGAPYARIEAARLYAFSFADVAAANGKAVQRLWRGWTTAANAAAYERLLRGEVVPAILARAIPGLVDVTILRRPDGELTEFVTIMRFRDLDAVRAFAGEDLEAAHVPPAARALLERFEERSAHYTHVATLPPEGP